MVRYCNWILVVGTCWVLANIDGATSNAGEPVTLENVVDPGENSPDEPLAESFSLERAAHFLDSAALQWQKQRNCMTCHTNYLYLMSRPALGADDEAVAVVREYAETLVAERWEEKGPRWDAEVVMAGAVLAFHDDRTSGTLHPLTRRALDRMWTVQQADGGFDWLKCDWPPMESDDHFGATMALIGVGVAPDDYAQTPAAQAGVAKLRSYLAANPPPTLHHRAMIVWAGSYVDDLVSDAERTACVEALLALQQPDGGWATASLGDWQRGDDKEQDTETSDGYGTGFVLYVLRRAGLPAEHPQIQEGVAWLKTNQRESGRWFTRSLYRDNHHFLTHAGTSMAVMALDACDAQHVATRAAE